MTKWKCAFFCVCLIFCFVLHIQCQQNQCNGAQLQFPTEPCLADSNITLCVRRFLNGVAQCKELEDEGNDSIYRENMIRYLVVYNATTTENVTVTGLSSGKIDSFIVDYTNDLMVLTTRFVNLDFVGPTTWTYYQNNKEPVTINSYFICHFPEVIFTSVMKPATAPELSKTFTMANVTQRASFSLGENFENCQNPDIVKLRTAIYDAANADPSIPFSGEIETFQTFSPFIVNTYIRRNFCNY